MKKILSLVLLFGILFGVFPKNSFAEDRRIYEIEKKIEEFLSKRDGYYESITGEKVLYNPEHIDFFYIHNDDFYMITRNEEKTLNRGTEICKCRSLIKNGEKVLENLNIFNLFFLNGDYYVFEFDENHLYENSNTFIKNGKKITVDHPVNSIYYNRDIYSYYNYNIYIPSQVYAEHYNLQVKENGIYKKGELIISTTSSPHILTVDGEDIYYVLKEDNFEKVYKNGKEFKKEDIGIKEDIYLRDLRYIHNLKNGEKVYVIGYDYYKNGERLSDSRMNGGHISGNDFYSYLTINDTFFVKKNGKFYTGLYNGAGDIYDLENDIFLKMSFDEYKNYYVPYTQELYTLNSKGDFYSIFSKKSDHDNPYIFKNGKPISESIKEYEEKLEKLPKIQGSVPNPEDLVLKNDDRVKVLDYLKNNSEEKVENKIEEKKSEIEKKLEKVEEDILENEENLELNSATEKTEMKVEEEKKSEKIENKKEEIKYLEEFYFDKEIPEEIEEEKTEISENETKEEAKMNNLKITRLPKTGPLEIFLIIFSIALTFGIFKFRKRRE